MEAIFIWMGKTILTSGVMFSYYKLFLKDKTFHHYNRFYLLATVLISLFLPLLKLDYFTLEVSSNMYLILNKIQNFNSTNTLNNDSVYSELIFAAFGLVALFFLGRFLFGILKIFSFKRKYPKENFEGISFYQTNLTDAPFSFFKSLFWKDSILIQSDLGRQILKHEMVHVEQKHSYDKMVMEVIVSIFWFNPFFHLIKKEISLIHEYLADKKALKNSDTKAFAQMLLAGSFSGKVIPGTSPFLSSNLKKRLIMLKKSKTKYGYARKILALPILFALGFIYLVNAKNKEIAKNNREIENELSNLKQDTVRKSVTATLVEIKGGENYAITEASKAPENALFITGSKEVSKAEYLNYLESNKGNSTKMVSSFSSGKSVFGERGKNGVYHTEMLSEVSSNNDGYNYLIKKYNPNFERDKTLQESVSSERKAKMGANFIQKTFDYFSSEDDAKNAQKDASIALADAKQARLDALQATKDALVAQKDAERAAKDANSESVKKAVEEAGKQAKEAQKQAYEAARQAALASKQAADLAKSGVSNEKIEAAKKSAVEAKKAAEEARKNAGIEVSTLGSKKNYIIISKKEDGVVKYFVDGVEMTKDEMNNEVNVKEIKSVNVQKDDAGGRIYIVTKK
ncbi:M56 family metallopeptidase [uncultured Chryseobacterium sp.]|uniref:M56 family metallopeptidase n=1 Tax=uncultured Chryseobacterium sp. TaxID=259322 RepID=UPI00260ACD47|nr:M56 family metallopeptidase [uncultured Chryseobacterium sp.]